MDIVKVLANLPGGASLRGHTSFGKDDVRPVYEFLGVPYAQPPVGEGRFRPPKPLLLWKGERQAKKWGAMCPQKVSGLEESGMRGGLNTSEDCLYLNVWTPDLHPVHLMSVIVFIHGGGFAVGSGSTYRGTAMCSYHDVVFISINYRLGVFGFLSTGDDVAPGNYGLLDQIEALRWVQMYIKAFGGDADNVTVMGESAGGMSVSWLMTSQLSRGLFKRGISQSGTANMQRFVHTRAQADTLLTQQLAKNGVPMENSQQIVSYLKTLSSDVLLDKLGDKFRPVVGGHVINDVMVNRYKQPGAILNAEYLVGCNPRTFVWAFSMLDYNLSGLHVKNKKEATDIITKHIGRVMGIAADDRKAEQFGRLAVSVYFHGVREHDESELKERLIDFYTDCFFVVPIEEAARLHSGLNPTYFYVFDHRLSFSSSARWEQEMYHTLGLPLAKTKVPFSQQDRLFSKMLMEYWVNFARTGDPNGRGLIQWPRFTAERREYLTLSPSPSTGKSWLTAEKELFWRQDAAPLLKTGLLSKY